MRAALLVALVLGSGGCVSMHTLVAGRAVVVPGDHRSALRDLCSRPGAPAAEGSWTPDPEVVRAMERRFASLRRLRASRCCLIGARIKEPNDYRRQYFGIVVGGRRFIYINAEADFDREEGPPPDDVVLDVCDGGTSWGALYDPATGRFSELAFNGVP